MDTLRSKTYLSGFMAPVPDEIDAIGLAVTGTLPAELTGRYFRNGPNPLPGTDPGHNFAGQGMIHGVRLAGGRAEWYRNRWVRTPLFEGKRTGSLADVVANTHVIEHGGHIYALVENGLPYEISSELDTLGPVDFAGKLTTAMTAHPKEDPVTGDLHFFGYSARPPFLTYHVLSGGKLVRSTEITVPGPTMMHDFAVTEHYVVWLDLPVVFDAGLLGKNGIPYRWSDGYPARLGVMPRDGGDADVRWIDIAPGYAFHVGNAHEDDRGHIVLDAVRYDHGDFDELWQVLGGVTTPVESLASSDTGGVLYRWVVDPGRRTVSEHALDDAAVEFPTLNDEHVGRGNRYLYTVGAPFLVRKDTGPSVIKYDTAHGSRQVHALDPHWVVGEAVFVPGQDATAEDDGWLLSVITHETADAARLLVLDASDVAAGPVATVELPRRVPAGFHGSWIPDDAA
ncbi:carotenoid oxygenase family protein [Amycolatopsis sp.]|uniref:carotenoid oxygenase family protein n=1 Tax=Amycolatopsis sp. TaxID=37632 RepID=UPI002B8BAD2A|nr:carotenoid oxygenase family protein [Amycolatopsis sp.]HVV11725.1 carotenoid oxygenase family protein [Amycolatopsis sp.]